VLDTAYDVIETEIGPMLAATTDHGLARLLFDAEPETQLDDLARLAGPRVLRAPRALDQTRRELDEYFAGRRTAFDLTLDLRGRPAFTARVLGELARVPYGATATYGDLATRVGSPNASRAVGMVMNRNRIPIVLPCHRIVGSSGQLVGYAGGLERKEQLLRLEGALL
jgi:methylated-DNA-[protein]-cysteine S-methyltransferase